MAQITVTAAQVAPVFPDRAEIYDFIASATITKGQAVYQDASGGVALADGSTDSTAQFKGIAVTGAGTGGAVSVLKRGHVYGFTLSSADYDALLYVADTAGVLSDAAGTVTAGVGRVVGLTDADRTKVLYVDADWGKTYS